MWCLLGLCGSSLRDISAIPRVAASLLLHRRLPKTALRLLVLPLIRSGCRSALTLETATVVRLTKPALEPTLWLLVLPLVLWGGSCIAPTITTVAVTATIVIAGGAGNLCGSETQGRSNLINLNFKNAAALALLVFVRSLA